MLPLSPGRLFRVSKERATAVSKAASNCFSICHGKYFAIFAITTTILNPCYPHRGFQSVFAIHKDYESVLAIQRGFQSVFASHKDFQSLLSKKMFSESVSANVFSLSRLATKMFSLCYQSCYPQRLSLSQSLLATKIFSLCHPQRFCRNSCYPQSRVVFASHKDFQSLLSRKDFSLRSRKFGVDTTD